MERGVIGGVVKLERGSGVVVFRAGWNVGVGVLLVQGREDPAPEVEIVVLKVSSFPSSTSLLGGGLVVLPEDSGPIDLLVFVYSTTLAAFELFGLVLSFNTLLGEEVFLSGKILGSDGVEVVGMGLLLILLFLFQIILLKFADGTCIVKLTQKTAQESTSGVFLTNFSKNWISLCIFLLESRASS